MYSCVKSGSLFGLTSEIVTVEVDLSAGLPALTVVGLPDISVRESKERIRTAIINSGYKFPAKRITINLAPAGTKKEGTHFDLPISVGIMAAIGYIKKEKLQEYAFLGELSLDGSINRFNGALPLIIGLRNQGIRKIILPFANAEEASILDDVALYPVKHLSEIVHYFSDGIMLDQYVQRNEGINKPINYSNDFSDVAGQETVKRALQIGAAAAHNVLMIGPPGAGKTMIARRIPSILPHMSYDERLEVTKIYSVAGELNEARPMITERPFRSPHHTITSTALVGGGLKPKPGEVSLAHHGVLFLDELPEFNRRVLEMLRQPMEDECITISRMNSTVTFPSKIMLVAAMNPCICGYYGDPTHECICSPFQIHNYLSKISGPLLDRIDMHIEIMPVIYKELVEISVKKAKGSKEMREEIEKARDIQIDRYKSETISHNSQLTTGLMKKYCTLDKETKCLLEEAYSRLALSARAYNKIIKLSRTIADMEGTVGIELKHVAEAIQYRSLDKMYRGL